MSISSTLDRLHRQAKGNSWLWLFSLFCRFALAAGFIPSGAVKIIGERFAGGVNANHPMGHYLEALHTTGYYYTFIGVVQIAAAILLLIPRTTTLGAFPYFPIILNICILTFAVRFDGSMFTAPLMVLANLFLLGWNYEKWKYILPFNRQAAADEPPERESLESRIQTEESERKRTGFSRYGLSALFERLRIILKQLLSDKFPTLFFAGVFAVIVFFAAVVPKLYDVLPKNSFAQCQRQFKGDRKTRAAENFCGCVHTNGQPLDKCLDEYYKAPKELIEMP